MIPCYRVGEHILALLAAIGPEVSRVYCIDDKCPEGSGDLIESGNRDPRVTVLRHVDNLGVGGAVMTGYRQAIRDGATIIIKLDGDGQMDPSLIPLFAAPILRGESDYTKGNRFYDLQQIHQMPVARIVGNALLSFMTKFSTGYWDVFDPTNGYTAIHSGIARRIPFDKVSQRYFFESDLLFRLGTFCAVVVDVPMDAHYGTETSGINAGRIVFEFAFKHAINMGKRFVYNYLLRDMPLASLQLIAGTALLAFGSVFGSWHWWLSASTQVRAPLGTIMVATMSVLVGLELVLAFLAYDIANVPRRPLQRLLGPPSKAHAAALERQ